ncbi:MAPEG family protein [Bradyrhizobium sp. 83012]|uniref:MAPEG family protein n=1 Tax=Bradyrhizobium aeschynomenes TaxID=2734909 RepID=A0ABX2CCV8_9BRAD|nr:MAPEG family protein [Bradyrhizobium aeschynomenes]NPU65315.1 MAPEG family protein [Bradyrhizobium aeschynomenes]
MYHFTALVSVLALMLYFYMGVRVAQARARFGVKAPAVTGNLDFERTYRVQANTLEWLPIFLPAMWLFAVYVSDGIAALIGLVWIAGRAMYMVSYAKAAEKRGPGFGVQALAASVLLAGALIAILWRMLHG